MFSSVYSGGLLGIDGYLVQVEADVSDGLPAFSMVGFLASEVKEAEQRVRSAMKNSGFRLDAKKITVNLSPAHIKKKALPMICRLQLAFWQLMACLRKLL